MEAASVARFENPSSKADKMPPLLSNGQGTAAFLRYDEAVIQRHTDVRQPLENWAAGGLVAACPV
ncbi:hypothetical protein [Paenibacillus sp. VMFN-D1]|uniref:hypothetical protein n=1 Tax=Paenibacillus sp. VMFN-D1 TaxID=2135608 RepID=UPI000E2893D7|nr:hypothetical protein [Paenibacillus sp. VMFN-D1]